MLIDMTPDLASGLVAYSGESVTSLKENLNKALLKADPLSSDAKVVTWLNNGGIPMELDSDESVEWFAHQPV